MGRNARKRSTLANRAIAATAALIMGGGGLVAANVYANAGEGRSGQRSEQQQRQNSWQAMATIDCPEVGNDLREVPRQAKREVARELARMDTQITEAYKRFAEEKWQIQRDPKYAQNAILNPLKSKRVASIDRISIVISRWTQRPRGLDRLATCTLQADDNDTLKGGNQNDDNNDGNNNDNGGNNDNDNGGNQDNGNNNDGNNDGNNNNGNDNNGNGGQAGNGPEANDFVDIQDVQPNVREPRQRRNASRGVFTTKCGVNENGKFNPDNVIVAPGVANGAHHMHDYVGNQETDAFSSDDDLARGETTCRNQGDKSTYYWPVLRLQNGQDENDANEDGGGNDQNVGEIQTPTEVTLDFEGSPVSKVTAMPRFLRIITGDAKAFTNGDANANASWSCTGFEDRQLKDKYPICPEGSQVVRTFKFQSCWDGQNTDSANHRTHVAFANENGNCPNGFQAIPQLVQRIVYDVPQPSFGDNGVVYAVDSFPEQLHKAITDHGDFINVFDERLMDQVVFCINSGRRCR
ncbi:DUF1996 domain-containing protein [Streptomyces sp. MUM 178J]|uniref:DUF1996 domain-containing protein n=1 Tax=Streptomyces sp. MUM 178J TaxID=2791991 RepID=UPI001F045B98|nr:DUF1996 domain-containing protein [Streptomyces sp. MUM 178J]WRQ79127.1 DUF1996 domain-containing protein [Streptomyces sp. MUM 178J]